MYKVIFKYADGRKGECTRNGKTVIFDSLEEANRYAAENNNLIEEELKEFFPTWHAERV